MRDMKPIKDLDFIQNDDCFEVEDKSRNSNKYDYKQFCSCCGRGIKGEPKYWLNTAEGPSVIPFDTTEEELLERNGVHSQGMFPIGSECRKRYPKEYVGKK